MFLDIRSIKKGSDTENISSVGLFNPPEIYSDHFWTNKGYIFRLYTEMIFAIIYEDDKQHLQDDFSEKTAMSLNEWKYL